MSARNVGIAVAVAVLAAGAGAYYFMNKDKSAEPVEAAAPEAAPVTVDSMAAEDTGDAIAVDEAADAAMTTDMSINDATDEMDSSGDEMPAAAEDMAVEDASASGDVFGTGDEGEGEEADSSGDADEPAEEPGE